MPLSMFSVAALAAILSTLLATAHADDQANFTDADFEALDITRLDEIVEDARSKFNNVDANRLFINDPSVGEYFDNIATAAGFIEVALKVYPKGVPTYSLVPKYKAINYAVDKIFEGSSSKTDEQAAPFGVRECWLLPEQLRNFTIVPLVGVILSALTAKRMKYGGVMMYNYDTLRTTCTTSTVDDSLETLEALMGENCSKSVGRNDSVEEAIQEGMVQYAEGLDDGNRCLHVFVARHTKSAEAVAMFKMSLDKYYLAAVTIQAFCAVVAPNASKEAFRAKVMATHSSFAKGLPRIDAVQLNDTGPWNCDSKPDEMIAAARASREYIMSKVQSNSSFLGDLSPEQYVNMTFEMVDVLRSVDKASFEWLQNASTGPRDAEVRKRTRLSVMDLMLDLLNNLEWIHGHLPKPFGSKKDVLWPEWPSVGSQYDWPSKTVSDMLQNLARAFKIARDEVVDDKNDDTDGDCAHLPCRGFDLKRAATSMMGGCETDADDGSEDNDETFGRRMMEYAMTHGFVGCEDNKCLPLFIARYTNHAIDAVDRLKVSADKYARFLVFIQSVCASFPFEDPARKEDMRQRAVSVIQALKENVTGGLNTSSWEDRQRLHELVANGTVKRLNYFNYRDGYNFTALAYLPFTDDGLHVLVRLPVGAEDVIRNESKRVKYVVSRFPKRASKSLALIRAKWDAIKNKGNQILDATFSTKASNLSKRIEEVENRFKTDIDGAFLSAGSFRALVAMRCGYAFVWYELGYRYFPAGLATDGFVLATKPGNKYKSNCGQLVFFP